MKQEKDVRRRVSTRPQEVRPAVPVHAQAEPARGPATDAVPPLGRNAARDLREQLIGGVLFACAAFSTLVTVGIVLVLAGQAFAFFREVSILEFFTGTRWQPTFAPASFGVLPLLVGSLQIAVGSAVIALPVGLLTAIFLSEYSNERLRKFLKPALEILAGVPTVVYGYFALTWITPKLRLIFPEISVFNALSAAIVVGIMIVPTVASLSEDALRAVPRALRHGAFALGATRLEVVTRVVVPSALSGVLAAFLLGISRAIGETVAVFIAAGNLPNLTINPLESVQTMTAFIVQVSQGDTPQGSIVYKALFAVGMTLFLITLGMNILSQWIMARFREVYE